MEWFDGILSALSALSARASQALPGRVYNATGYLAAYFVFFYVSGRIAKLKVGQYTQKGFLGDLFFWFYYRLGVHSLLCSYWLFTYLGPMLPQVNVLEGWSYWPRFLVYYVAADFLGYWYHRLRHHVGFLWAFHTMHHAPERMTFATELRTHPVEMAWGEIMMYVPLFFLGAAPEFWFPLMVARGLLEVAEHSELPWRFGPLYYVFVSPAFHAVHHSVDPRHHDKNFGVNLTIWDYMFGTFVDEPELPKAYGLPDVKMHDIKTELILPFQLIRRRYARGPAPTPTAAPAALDYADR